MTQQARTTRARALGEVIGSDRPCRKCGYSLKGLHAGGVCPECGTGIPGSKPRVLGGDNLSDAPVRYLRRLSLGLGLAAMGLVSIVVGLLYVRGASGAIGPGMLGAGAVLWMGGVWIGGGRRPRQESTLKEPLLDHAQWLLWMRIAQAAWLLPAGFAALRWVIASGTSTAGLDFALAGLNVSAVLAFVATVPALAFFNALATWAGDSSLAARLHTSAWGIAICGVAGPVLFFGAELFGPVRLPAMVVGGIMMVLLGGCLVVAVISVVQIASVSFLAISSNAAAEARDARLAQKRAQEAEELVRKQLENSVEAVKAAPGPRPVRPAPPAEPQERSAPTPTYRTGGHRVEGTGDEGETYDLAPEQ